MNGNRGDLFPCYNCGAINVTGDRACRNCGASMYYNCPHCNAWVDNRLLNCPGCRKSLNWPKPVVPTVVSPYVEPGSTPSAAVLLILCCVLLSVITFGLIIHSSNSATAMSGNSITTSSPALTADTPQIVNSSPNQSSYTGTSVFTPAYTPTPAPANNSSTTYITSPAQGLTQNGTIIVIPFVPTSAASAASISRSRSPYLESVYPGWGRCSGGRCGTY